MMAAPRKKLPERSVDVMCKCKTRLFKYKKGGNGSLVKCYVERIVQDFRSEEDKQNDVLKCPACATEFARHALVHGRPAYKMIGGEAKRRALLHAALARVSPTKSIHFKATLQIGIGAETAVMMESQHERF